MGGMAKRWWPILVFLLVTLLPLAPLIFKGHAPGPWDHINTMIPGSKVEPPKTPWDVLQADACLQSYVWRDLVLKSPPGQAVYNPYQFGGYDLTANSQAAPFYPPHILLNALNPPVGLSLTLLAWFHLFWAGLGVFVVARLTKANEAGALIAGICFSLSPFLLAWLGLASVPTTVAWIPWCIAAALFAATPVPFWQRCSAVAGSVGMLLLAGHLQFAAFGLMALAVAGLTVVFRSLNLDRRLAGQASLACVVGIFLAGMLALPQLLPALEASKESHRRNTPTEQGFDIYKKSALIRAEQPALLLPSILGSPIDFLETEDGEKVNGYWPALMKPGGNFAESAVGWGPVVLGLVAMVRIRRHQWADVAPVLVVGVIGLIFALGHPALRLLYMSFPGWSSTGSPARGGVLFLLAGCVLAARGVRWGNEEEALTAQRYEIRAYGSLILVAAALIWAWFVHPMAASSLIDSAPWIFVGALFLPLLSLWRADIRLLAPLAVLVQLGMNGGLIRSGAPATTDLPKPEGRVAIVNETWNLYRTPTSFLPPNLAALYGVPEVGGYDSMIRAATYKRLEGISQASPSPPENGNMAFVKPSFTIDSLIEEGVREVWSLRPLNAGALERIEADGFFRYRIPGAPTLKVVAPDEVEIGVAGAILPVGYDARWKGTHEGRPVRLGESGGKLALQEVLPAGSKVILKFQDRFQPLVWGAFALFWVGIGVLIREYQEKSLKNS